MVSACRGTALSREVTFGNDCAVDRGACFDLHEPETRTSLHATIISKAHFTRQRRASACMTSRDSQTLRASRSGLRFTFSIGFEVEPWPSTGDRHLQRFDFEVEPWSSTAAMHVRHVGFEVEPWSTPPCTFSTSASSWRRYIRGLKTPPGTFDTARHLQPDGFEAGTRPPTPDAAKTREDGLDEKHASAHEHLHSYQHQW